MSIETGFTVYRRKMLFDSRGTNFPSGQTEAHATETIRSIVPSVCKTDRGTHGLVMSKVTINTETGEPLHLYCNESVATLAALDDA